MRIAIISDIHGNYDALKVVYSNIGISNVDEIVCLGDLIGYGPQPEEVVRFIIEKNIPCVMGDHELAIIDDDTLNNFSDVAKASIEITRNLISENTLEYISKLPVTHILGDILFVHGTPPNLINKYFDNLRDAEYRSVFRTMKQQFAFIGHTHEQLCFYYNGHECNFKILKRGLNKISPKMKYIINVGSVGLPRDGSYSAKYVIFDNNDFTINLKCLPYDIGKTAYQILKLGFPEWDVDHLYSLRD